MRQDYQSTEYLKIRKQSSPDLVTEKILGLISSGSWKVNEKIPSEQVLSKMFAVSRATIRTVLQRLNTLDVLDTRNGDGTYVRSFDFEQHMKNIHPLLMTPDLLNDVTEFRLAIEIPSARLAIQNQTEEDLLAFKKCAQSLEESMTRYVNAKNMPDERQLFFDRFNEDDIIFHTQLCRMSHNKLLLNSYIGAKEVIRQHMKTIGYPRVEKLNPGDFIQSVEDHWKIYEMIRAKKYMPCKKLLRDMING